ncbi:MAG: hypothetical protein H0Z24_02845 [Thermosipho sp. (in: Bacteria)]|nr:hypothetical protein [Thermosipho sp. (in: thermotogales)]
MFVMEMFSNIFFEEKKDSCVIKWKFEEVDFGWRFDCYIKGKPGKIESMKIKLSGNNLITDKGIFSLKDANNYSFENFVFQDGYLFGLLNTKVPCCAYFKLDKNFLSLYFDFAETKFENFDLAGSILVLKLDDVIYSLNKYVEHVLIENDVRLKKLDPVIFIGKEFLNCKYGKDIIRFFEEKKLDLFVVDDSFVNENPRNILNSLGLIKLKAYDAQKLGAGFGLKLDIKDLRSLDNTILEELFIKFKSLGIRLLDFGDTISLGTLKFLKKLKNQLENIILLAKNTPLLSSAGIIDVLEINNGINYEEILIRSFYNRKVFHMAIKEKNFNTDDAKLIFGILNISPVIDYEEVNTGKIYDYLKGFEEILNLRGKILNAKRLGEKGYEIVSYNLETGRILTKINFNENVKIIKDIEGKLNKKVVLSKDKRKFYFYGGDI